MALTFAFVCVDKGPSRLGIFELLLSRGIPFIDVGMGLNRKNGALNGMIRTTYFSAADGKRVRDKGLAELSENTDDLYRTNIQISELNALNACLSERWICVLLSCLLGMPPSCTDLLHTPRGSLSRGRPADPGIPENALDRRQRLHLAPRSQTDRPGRRFKRPRI